VVRSVDAGTGECLLLGRPSGAGGVRYPGQMMQPVHRYWWDARFPLMAEREKVAVPDE
jgi:hypothetical protein